MATADDRPGDDGEGESVDDAPDDDAALSELAYVGPATEAALAAADVTVADVREKTVSYRELVRAGVNPGVAAKLRREHSLHWTIEEQGADLDRRSKHVRGLRDGEREWVAATDGSRDRTGGEPSGDAAARTERAWVEASTDGEADAGTGTPAETDGAGDAFAAEAAWRERARSPPVTALPAVGPAEADRLEALGVDTVRRLATADPSYLATRLGVSVDRVREWCAAARARTD